MFGACLGRCNFLSQEAAGSARDVSSGALPAHNFSEIAARAQGLKLQRGIGATVAGVAHSTHAQNKLPLPPR